MRHFGLILGLFALCLTASSADEAPAPAAPLAAAPPAKAGTPPKFLSGPEAQFPDAARANGEFGKVVVSGTIGVDGRLHDAKIEVSSRSDLLDASALTAANAAVFAPAQDATGTPIAKAVKIPYDFSNARTPGKGGGALRYHCDQFVRDYDWWYKTWPADKHDDFYSLVLGYVFVLRLQQPDAYSNPSATANTANDLDRHWHQALEDCRKTPDKLFIDVLKPEGELLRRLAGG